MRVSDRPKSGGQGLSRTADLRLARDGGNHRSECTRSLRAHPRVAHQCLTTLGLGSRAALRGTTGRRRGHFSVAADYGVQVSLRGKSAR